MRVIDPARAATASLLLVVAFAVNVGLTLLWFAASSLAAAGPSWWAVQSLLWLAPSVVIIAGLGMLAAAVEEKGLLLATAGAWAVMSLFDVGEALARIAGGLGSVSELVNQVDLLVSLVARLLLFVVLVRFTLATRAWVAPLLGLAAVLSIGRTALTVATLHHVVSLDVYRSLAYRVGLGFSSVYNTLALVAAGLALRNVVQGAVAAPAHATAGLVPAPPEPVAPAADFVVGAILLAVGVGASLISLQAASNGGRYFIATGAIGVGAGRIIRGFIRLAKSG